MYEIFLFFHILVLFLGCVRLANDPSMKRGLILIFIGTLLGAMTKRSFLLFMPVLPVILYLEVVGFSPMSSALLDPDKRKKMGFGCLVAGSAILTAILAIVLTGAWDNFLKFTQHVAATPENSIEIVKTSLLAIQALKIDGGFGLFLGYFALLIYWAIKRRWIFLIFNILLVTMVFYGTVFSARVFMARYYLPTYAVLLYSLFLMLSKFEVLWLRKVFLIMILCFQLPAIYNTTYPLMYDHRKLIWTQDETTQHMNGYAPGTGYFALRDKILEISKESRIELRCEGEFTFVLCDYLPVYYPNAFKNKLPVRNLLYLKTYDQHPDYTFPSDPLRPNLSGHSSLLFFYDQSTAGSPNRGYVYLVDQTKNDQ